jgi:hypothetical protein
MAGVGASMRGHGELIREREGGGEVARLGVQLGRHGEGLLWRWAACHLSVRACCCSLLRAAVHVKEEGRRKEEERRKEKEGKEKKK